MAFFGRFVIWPIPGDFLIVRILEGFDRSPGGVIALCLLNLFMVFLRLFFFVDLTCLMLLLFR